MTRSALASRAARSAFSGSAPTMRRELARQRRDALDALALRAELLVEHDRSQASAGGLRACIFRSRLPEEVRVGQARADDALIAGDDRLAAVARLDVGDEDEWLASLRRASRVASTRSISGWRGSSRGSPPAGFQKRLVELAHQHDRPFDQPGDLFEQRPRPRPVPAPARKRGRARRAG